MPSVSFALMTSFNATENSCLIGSVTSVKPLSRAMWLAVSKSGGEKTAGSVATGIRKVRVIADLQRQHRWSHGNSSDSIARAMVTARTSSLEPW